MGNRLYYTKIFFLQYKALFLWGSFVFLFGFCVAAFVFRGPKIPQTEEDYSNAMRTGEQLYQHKRYEEAFEYLVYPAEHGYPKARFLLGEMYYNALGVEKDAKKAFENFKSVSDDLPEAGYMAASMVFRGEVKDVPKGMATIWLTQSAYHGSTGAQRDLGIYSLMSEDYEQAYFWLSLAASDGSERVLKARETASERLTDYQRGLLNAEIKGFVARK